VRALVLEFGADASTADKNGHTPVYIAALIGHTETVRALVQECGQDVNVANEQVRFIGNSLIHMAAALGDTEMVRMLLNSGADPNALNEFGFTPVSMAAHNGHTETVQVMNHLRKRGFRAAEPSRFCVEFPRRSAEFPRAGPL
jgi:ankyrin repeat protein